MWENDCLDCNDLDPQKLFINYNMKEFDDFTIIHYSSL